MKEWDWHSTKPVYLRPRTRPRPRNSQMFSNQL